MCTFQACREGTLEGMACTWDSQFNNGTCCIQGEKSCYINIREACDFSTSKMNLWYSIHRNHSWYELWCTEKTMELKWIRHKQQMGAAWWPTARARTSGGGDGQDERGAAVWQGHWHPEARPAAGRRGPRAATAAVRSGGERRPGGARGCWGRPRDTVQGRGQPRGRERGDRSGERVGVTGRSGRKGRPGGGRRRDYAIRRSGVGGDVTLWGTDREGWGRIGSVEAGTGRWPTCRRERMGDSEGRTKATYQGKGRIALTFLISNSK